MFGKGMDLSMFYCLCYFKDVSTYMLEEQVSEERDPDLNEEEDIRMDSIREDHCIYVSDKGDDKKKMHALRWEIYVKENEYLTKREFLVYVPHVKGGNIV